MSTRTRRILGSLLATMVLGLGACDSGDSGPGGFDGRVTSADPVGALVVELRGVGIEAVEGGGSTRVYHARVSEPGQGGRAVHRAVLIAEGPGELRFRVRVEDVGAGAPTVAVISAADAGNRPLLSPGTVSVTLSR